MEEVDRVAIARLVLRTKEYLAAIRVTDGVLTLSTMLFHDELVAPEPEPVDESTQKAPTKQEKQMAQQLIDSLTGHFDPKKYRDEYRERVLDLIERKAAGEEIAVQPEVAMPSPAPDLLAALEASLAKTKSDGRKKASAAKPSKRAKPKSRSS
jgi:DNA end-binding protein Ku